MITNKSNQRSKLLLQYLFFASLVFMGIGVSYLPQQPDLIGQVSIGIGITFLLIISLILVFKR